MNKTILVFYVNVGSLTPREIDLHISSFIADTNINDENILSYFIPIRTGETRIECINPVYVSKKNYKGFIKILDEYKRKVDEFTKKSGREETIIELQDKLQSLKDELQKLRDLKHQHIIDQKYEEAVRVREDERKLMVRAYSAYEDLEEYLK